MRVAILSTPFVAVPPLRYGGTELVVGELALGLRDAGHQVRLYTIGCSTVAVERRARTHEACWPPDPYQEMAHASWAIADLLADDQRFDVIHAHVPAVLPLARFAPAPVVYTIHHERSEALSALYAEARGARLVAISERQRELMPELDGVEVVHHGLTASRYPLGPGGPSAVFLGRLACEKGPHRAIDVARRAGVPLILGGIAHWRDQGYFRREVEPRLALAGPEVSWIGEVGHESKVRLLGAARALLFPIDWEEPFGLVMIEAMLCGTPVLAPARGSVPEVIDQGVTGFVCDSDGEMAARLRQLDRFDRAACRARAVERFGRDRMVRDYLAIYRRAAERPAIDDAEAAASA